MTIAAIRTGGGVRCFLNAVKSALSSACLLSKKSLHAPVTRYRNNNAMVPSVPHAADTTARLEMPKIVFAAQYFFPLVGGAEHSASILLQGLAKRGCRVEAICQGPGESLLHNGIPVRRVPGPDTMKCAIVTAKPDVLLTQLHLAPFVIQTARHLRIPAVLIVPSHEPVCPAPMELVSCDRRCRRCPHWQSQKDFMLQQRRAIEEADALCSCSRYMAGIIEEFYGRQSFVWYPPLDRSSQYCADPDPDGRRYITMCTAIRFKGIETFAAIARRLPEYRFLVAGRGNPETYGLHDMENLSCWPDTTPARFYAATILMLVPSIGPEAFGRTAIEAMANGIPVVASCIGGMPEAVGEAGVLIQNIHHIPSWTEQIRRLLSDPALYREYQERGFRHCEKFSSDRTIAAFEAHLMKLLETPARGSAGAWRSGSGNNAKSVPPRPLHIVWEGALFRHHSFALVNREICRRLLDAGGTVSILSCESDQFCAENDQRLAARAANIRSGICPPADIHVRHRWPPDFSPPPSGRWVMIQPWEFGSLPESWVDPIVGLVDEVWAPTTFVQDTYIQAGVPSELVQVIPWGVDTRFFSPDARPAVLATRKRFKFLFVGGTIHRKGIDVLLTAYIEAFTSADDVCLVIKDVGFYQEHAAAETVRATSRRPGAPEILYMNEDVPPGNLPGLYTACDCLVHPYRGEGYGLPIAEAMACALPVIVTGSGACLDFCSVDTARLVSAQRRYWDEKRVGDLKTVGNPFLAEPDITALAEHMRAVYNDRPAARALGRRACTHIRKNFTWDRTVRKIIERCEALRKRPVRRFQATAPQSCCGPHGAAWNLLDQGQEFRRKGDRQSAHAVFKQITEQYPEFEEGFTALGALLDEIGDREHAVSALRRAAELAPRSVSTYLRLGTALIKYNDHDNAEKAFKKARSLDFSALQPAIHLINLYRAQNRLSEAGQLLKTLISDNNRRAPILSMLGSISVSLQDAEGVVEAVRHLEKISPDHPTLTSLRHAIAGLADSPYGSAGRGGNRSDILKR